MQTTPAQSFVRGLDLPEEPPALEALTDAVEFSNQTQVVAVGAQMAEFSEQVSPALRSAVSDCLLLAQLAANKATASQPDVMAWYRKYVEVLQGVGWTVQSMSFQRQDLSALNGGVHKAIIPVITAMLGPAVAAASMVVSVLSGLQEMDKDSPWITVFDRASQHASGAKFQFAFVQADSAGSPQIRLLALAIDAHRTITQVLFFRFSDQSSELSTAESALGIDAARLESIKAPVAARVQPFLSDFLANIDI